ncbi:dihydrofolate synthase [Malassezia sp. CBS 17886]|nr:dihydrofolate synthase [Malassezia sp. CBS 17886]
MDLGLGRVQALLRRVGSPQTRFPVIHVAGTNGKGSTTAYLDALLTHAVGVRSARFNSPHLITARDSVRVAGGEPVDERIWALAEERTRRADASAADGSAPIHATPFELLTVGALVAFSLLPPAQQPDVLLIEVGVGGRLDATNVFPDDGVLASVICPIARDHEALLGHGLAAITKEKAGIIKPHGLAVIADQASGVSARHGVHAASASVMAVLQEACTANHARVAYGRIPWHDMRWGPRAGDGGPDAAPPYATAGGTAPALRAPAAFTLPLYDAAPAGTPPAGHVPLRVEGTLARISGCCTALQTLWSIAHDTAHRGADSARAAQRQELRDRIRARLFTGDESGPRIQHALRQMRWEGRCEWHTTGEAHTPLLLDGAHNEASARALRTYLEKCFDAYADAAGAPVHVCITWVLAFSQGKDAHGMLDVLLRDWPTQARSWTCRGHRVALTSFSTPVEGMPWVQPAPTAALQRAVEERVPGGDWLVQHGCMRTFPTLQDALAWGAERPTGDDALHVVVVGGSLYLVSDYYRHSARGQAR